MKNHSDSLGRTVLIAVIAGVLFAGFLALTPRLTAGTSETAVPGGPADVTLPDAAAIGDPVLAVADGAFDGFDDDTATESDADDVDFDDGECTKESALDAEECTGEDTDDDSDDSDDDSDDEWTDDDADGCTFTDCACECVCACDRDADDGGDGWVDDEAWKDEWREDGDTEFDGTLELTVEVLGQKDGKESLILSDYDMARFEFTLANTSSEELWGAYLYLEGLGEVDCPSTYLGPYESMHCSAVDRVYSGDQTAVVWGTAWTDAYQVGVEVHAPFWVAE
jgi:hypothetical protein